MDEPWHGNRYRRKHSDKWDDTLLPYGQPNITNLLMPPFERQDGDVNRAWTEGKGCVYLPVLRVMQEHLESFKEFPPRPGTIQGDVTRMIRKTMSRVEASRRSGTN